MAWKQTRKVNTNKRCTPGYCLVYVQDTFGIPAKYPSALAAWNASKTKHRDTRFPASITVPVWFTGKSGALKEFGHVADRMPDGSVWSCSHPTSSKPMHFASIDALNQYYGGQLIYLGWTEDVEDVRVVKEEEEMTAAEKAKYNIGVVYSSLVKLDEGNIIFEATINGHQWKLDTVVDQKAVSAHDFKKGDLFVCQYYADITYKGKKYRYYMSESDILAGRLWGINRNDAKIVKQYK